MAAAITVHPHHPHAFRRVRKMLWPLAPLAGAAFLTLLALGLYKSPLKEVFEYFFGWPQPAVDALARGLMVLAACCGGFGLVQMAWRRHLYRAAVVTQWAHGRVMQRLAFAHVRLWAREARVTSRTGAFARLKEGILLFIAGGCFMGLAVFAYATGLALDPLPHTPTFDGLMALFITASVAWLVLAGWGFWIVLRFVWAWRGLVWKCVRVTAGLVWRKASVPPIWERATMVWLKTLRPSASRRRVAWWAGLALALGLAGHGLAYIHFATTGAWCGRNYAIWFPIESRQGFQSKPFFVCNLPGVFDRVVPISRDNCIKYAADDGLIHYYERERIHAYLNASKTAWENLGQTEAALLGAVDQANAMFHRLKRATPVSPAELTEIVSVWDPTVYVEDTAEVWEKEDNPDRVSLRFSGGCMGDPWVIECYGYDHHAAYLDGSRLWILVYPRGGRPSLAMYDTAGAIRFFNYKPQDRHVTYRRPWYANGYVMPVLWILLCALPLAPFFFLRAKPRVQRDSPDACLAPLA